MATALLWLGCSAAPPPIEPPPPPEATPEGDVEVALTLQQVAAFDLMLALPPAAEPMDDPPTDTLLFLDPETGWVLSIERRGGGVLPPLDLEAVAGRAAKAQGATSELVLHPGELGDSPTVQVDFKADAAATSTAVAWRNGSLYLFGITDPGGGEGVPELLRLLSAAASFTSERKATPEPGPDPLAPLGVVLPATRGLAISVDGRSAQITDVAAGFVTVLAGFPTAESPYAGLRGLALSAQLESEGCSVVGSRELEVAGRSARQARCVLGATGPRPEYALLHVVAADRFEWVVSVVSGDPDWDVAQAYASSLFGPDATLP